MHAVAPRRGSTARSRCTAASVASERRAEWAPADRGASAALPAIESPSRRRGDRAHRGPTGSRITRSPIDADAELVCLLLDSATTLESGWLARLAAAVDGTTVTAAAPARRASDARPRSTPHRTTAACAPAASPSASRTTPPSCGPPTRARSPTTPEQRPGPVDRLRARPRRASWSTGARTKPPAGSRTPAISIWRCSISAGGCTRSADAWCVVPDAVVVDHRPVRTRVALEQPMRGEPGGVAGVRRSSTVRRCCARPSRCRPGCCASCSRSPRRRRRSRPAGATGTSPQAFARGARGAGPRRARPDARPRRRSRGPVVRRALRDPRSRRRAPHRRARRTCSGSSATPRRVTAEECDRADLVLVASDAFRRRAPRAERARRSR